jgi:hypothetical protein
VSIHIYRIRSQPLTRWRIGSDILSRPSRWFHENPRRQCRCHKCYRLRYAKNLSIQVRYDGSYVFCADGCPPSTYKERYARLRKWRAQSEEAK